MKRLDALSLCASLALCGAAARADDASLGDATQPDEAPPINPNQLQNQALEDSDEDRDSAPSEPRAPQGAASESEEGEDEDDDSDDPLAAPPSDPLAIPESAAQILGTGGHSARYGAVGDVQRSFRGYYQEQRGDYRLRLLPPLYLEHTRGLGQLNAQGQSEQDTQSLFGLLYYKRRSLRFDADVLFPLAWRLRHDQRKTYIFGPLVHQYEPAHGENKRSTHTNWLAPLYFEGTRQDGGYFHAPLLLTSINWSEKKSHTWIGPYLRLRKDAKVDLGLFPLYFHGDNHDQDGARKQYTLIPPALYYQRYRQLDEQRLTIVGPVYRETNLKRSITNVLPLFWHIEGRPQTGGVREHHTTFLPFFHYGRSEEKSLLVLPGYLRRVTAEADTMLTPFYSRASARGGRTVLYAAGPVLPLFMHYQDKDIGKKWTGLFPLAFYLNSPRGYTVATPLFVHDRSYGSSRTNWVFPNVVWGGTPKSKHFDIYPLFFFGKKEHHRHTILAPIYWDVVGRTTRTTIGFPLYWRFADHETQSVTQIAANTVYVERRVRGGQDWQFHFAPLFSYGKNPRGHFWNVLFGLAGYSRKGDDAYVRALWLPIRVAGDGNGQSGKSVSSR